MTLSRFRPLRRVGALAATVVVLSVIAGAQPAVAFRADPGTPSGSSRAEVSAPSTSRLPGARGRTVTPEQYGATGDGRTDDTQALQRALDGAGDNGTVRLRTGATYRHTDVLHVRQPGEEVVGRATVLATNPERSSFWIEGDHVTVDGPTFQTVNVTQRYYAYEQMGLRIAGAAYSTVRHVRVVGAAAAGIYVGASCCQGPMTRAHDFRIDTVRVVGSHADGIHMTSGSHNGVVVHAVTTGTGDDGIAVVSYQQDRVPCQWIRISRSRVRGTTWGRGISVVGGSHITYSRIHIARSDAAAIYLAQEAGAFNTLSTTQVTVRHVTIDHANVDPRVGHGAVMIYAATPGLAVRGVRVRDVTIRNTTRTAPWQVGIRRDSGEIAAVSLSHLRLAGQPTPLVANVPKADYAAWAWTINGRVAASVTGRHAVS